MRTGIYEFWFFGSKNGRFVTHNCFSKKRAFLGQDVKKKGNFEKTPKKKKNLADN